MTRLPARSAGPAPIAVRHAWLQKHPTPAADGGEFHWYPADGERELRAELVDRVRGVEPPAVLWRLAPGRVAWARAFAAHAPTDGRRYVGLAVAIAEGDAPTAALIAALDVPAPMPWYPTPAGLRDVDTIVPCDLDRRDAVAIARGLIGGGLARIADPTTTRLAETVGALEARMPPQIRDRVRWGGCLTAARGDVLDAGDAVAALAVSAWLEPRSVRADGWQVLCDLAAARGESLDAIARRLGAPATAALSDEEQAMPRPGDDLADVLHAWGRGRFELCPTAGTLVDRLADAVALRALSELAAGRDPEVALVEARWYSMLPADRRDDLMRAIAARAPALHGWIARLDDEPEPMAGGAGWPR